jgi:hypothetical protein
MTSENCDHVKYFGVLTTDSDFWRMRSKILLMQVRLLDVWCLRNYEPVNTALTPVQVVMSAYVYCILSSIQIVIRRHYIHASSPQQPQTNKAYASVSQIVVRGGSSRGSRRFVTWFAAVRHVVRGGSSRGSRRFRKKWQWKHCIGHRAK